MSVNATFFTAAKNPQDSRSSTSIWVGSSPDKYVANHSFASCCSAAGIKPLRTRAANTGRRVPD